MKHILSVSYDAPVAKMRATVLSEAGFKVVTAIGMKSALELCQTSGFDLIILGQSVPAAEKRAIFAEFREHSSAPALTILRAGERENKNVEYHLDADEGTMALLSVVRRIFAEHHSVPQSLVRPVWIVEDETPHIRTCAKVLSLLGINKTEIKREIWTAVRDLNALLPEPHRLPNLIVLDLVFGQESGFEVLRLWHSIPQLKAQTKVLVWTVLDEPEQQICRSFGVNNFVSKSDGEVALLNAVASAMDLAPSQG